MDLKLTEARGALAHYGPHLAPPMCVRRLANKDERVRIRFFICERDGETRPALVQPRPDKSHRWTTVTYRYPNYIYSLRPKLIRGVNNFILSKHIHKSNNAYDFLYILLD
jgi:hypothetical protein